MRKIRIGIPIIGGSNWLGGISYIELLCKALSEIEERSELELYLIVNIQTQSELKYHESLFDYLDGIICIDIQKLESRLTKIDIKDMDALFSFIDFYFPAMDAMPLNSSASWIPDFQHKHLPEYFPNSEIKKRDILFSRISSIAKLIVFSSNDAKNDFEKFYPNSKANKKVLPFYSLPNNQWYEIDSIEIQIKYGLPDKYIICCNQFWGHKNHRRLFEAILRLRENNQEVHLVCTGSIVDFRNTGYFESLQQFIKENDLDNTIFILGNIPREDQIQLIRRSLFLVQPSLFEGWSTVVEDARVLGKSILLSDLYVNMEQSPKYGTYFKRFDVDDLAKKIKEMYKQHLPGPEINREQEAIQDSKRLIKEYTDKFLGVVRSALEIYHFRLVKKNVTIFYQTSMENNTKSKTYKSILEQSYQHFYLKVIKKIEDIEYEQINSDYFVVVQEGFILNKDYLKNFLSYIEEEDDLAVCGIKRFGNDICPFYYPIDFSTQPVCIKQFSYSNMLFKTSSFSLLPKTSKELHNKQIGYTYKGLVKYSVCESILSRINKEEQLFVYGAGEHTKYLLSELKLSNCPIHIAGIIDQNASIKAESFQGYKIYHTSEMENLNIDKIIISSMTFEQEIFEYLSGIFDEEKLIRLYEYI